MLFLSTQNKHIGDFGQLGIPDFGLEGFVALIYLDDPLKCVTVQRRVTEAAT